jgi:ankyrin repeat protein
LSDAENDYSLALPPPAHAAVVSGDAEILELLLQNGFDVNSRDRFNLTPMHLAARHGRFDIAQMLLSAGARLNARSVDERTPLHEAAFRGEIPTLLMLMKRAPPDAINAVDRYDKTVLHALFQGVAERQERVTNEDELMHAWQAVIGAGVEPLALDLAGRTAFFLGSRQLGPAIKAFAERYPRVLELARKSGELPVHNAAYHNNWETFQFIVETLPPQLFAKAKEGPHGDWTPLHSAAAGGSIAIVQHLLEQAADINSSARGLTPLMIAASRGQTSIVRLLVDKGADGTLADSEGRSALHWAGRAGDGQSFAFLSAQWPELLDRSDRFGRKPTCARTTLDFSDLATLRPYLEGGGDANCLVPDRERETTLTHRIAEMGTPLEMEAIIEFGGDLLRKDGFGKNAIMRAIDKPNRATFEYLAKAGPVESVFDTASNGSTLLHRAAKSGLDYAIPILVNRGVPVMQRDLEGRIALHLAATAGHSSCVDMLLKIMRREDFDAIDLLTGRTALHKAIDHKRLDCVRLLLDAGADPGRRDFQGNSGYDLAERLDDDGDMAAVKVLINSRHKGFASALRKLGSKR